MSAPWGSMFTMDEFLEELAFSDHKMEFYGGRIVILRAARSLTEISALD